MQGTFTDLSTVAPLQGRGRAAVEAVAAVRARLFPRTLCVSRLVAGGFFDIFNTQQHAGKEPFIRLFRERVLGFHGIRPAPPTQHLRLLVRKQGRRGIHNFDETLRFLRGGCDGLCEGLHRAQPVAFHELSVKQQLRLVSRATLAVSPPAYPETPSASERSCPLTCVSSGLK